MTVPDQNPSDGAGRPTPARGTAGSRATATAAAATDAATAATAATAAEAALRQRQLRRPVPSRRLSRVHGQREARAAVRAVRERVGEAEPATGSGAPLGVLIGGSIGRGTLPGGPGGPVCARRVAVELVRLGRGTTQVVLPEWRPAIAVSIPTEQLLTATGVDPGGLAEARLSVLINPDALHDRELDLREWRAEPPAGRPGRTTRRRTGA